MEREGSSTHESGRTKDEQILDFVRKNPLAHEHEIAAAAQLSLSATHNRITRLRKLQQLRSGMSVNLHALGFRHKYRIDIKISPRDLENAVREGMKGNGPLAATLKNWPRGDKPNSQEVLAFHIFSLGENRNDLIVDDVSVLLGDPADLCAIVRLKNADYVYKFVTEELRMLPSIDNTSTCIEAWSCSTALQDRLLSVRPKRARKASKRNLHATENISSSLQRDEAPPT